MIADRDNLTLTIFKSNTFVGDDSRLKQKDPNADKRDKWNMYNHSPVPRTQRLSVNPS
jgi:hypothetical protein